VLSYRRLGALRWHRFGEPGSESMFVAVDGSASVRIGARGRWRERFSVDDSTAGRSWSVRARFRGTDRYRRSSDVMQIDVAPSDGLPNILVIMTDDQQANTDTYSVMPETMRRVRDNGVWFKNAVATTPLCCPSRVSIYTGQYVHNHGVKSNNPTNFSKVTDRTLQHELKARGYLTAVSGKLLNGYTENPPDFDLWAVTGTLDYRQATYNVNGTLQEVTTYSTSFIKDRAIEFLTRFEQEDERPWLMFVNPIAPHAPATPEDAFASAPVPPWTDNPARTESDISDKPDYIELNQRDKEGVQQLRERQLRSLMSVDAMAAELFNYLKSHDETNTMVWFMSDNGFMWHEHGLWDKRFPYNESVRIPMFLWWPGHVPAGDVRTNLVANIDVAPTIYGLTEIAPSHQLDGRSMLSSERKRILIEYWTGPQTTVPSWRSLWTPSSTYVEYTDSQDREYYGPDDPYQLENSLAPGSSNPPGDVGALSADLSAASTCAGTACP
jgi:hypothetical protein